MRLFCCRTQPVRACDYLLEREILDVCYLDKHFGLIGGVGKYLAKLWTMERSAHVGGIWNTSVEYGKKRTLRWNMERSARFGGIDQFTLVHCRRSISTDVPKRRPSCAVPGILMRRFGDVRFTQCICGVFSKVLTTASPSKKSILSEVIKTSQSRVSGVRCICT